MIEPIFLVLMLARRPTYLPDPLLTPGDCVPSATAADVCRPGYAARARHVTAAARRAVFLSYGIAPRLAPRYEVDHLISLELGGSNSRANLFPQAYDVRVGGRQYGARVKDAAEGAVHRAVCDGRVSLAEAQKIMATDWTVGYRRFVSPELPQAE